MSHRFQFCHLLVAFQQELLELLHGGAMCKVKWGVSLKFYVRDCAWPRRIWLSPLSGI